MFEFKTTASSAAATVEEVSYQGWERNLRLFRDGLELIVTLTVGPRILRVSLHGGPNLFKEYPEQLGSSGESEWRIRGGHRFWTAPENEHSYALDNQRVDWRRLSLTSVEISAPPNPRFGWQKRLHIELLPEAAVHVRHILGNLGTAPLALSPWALSVMAPGGTALLPQPPRRPHPSELALGTPFAPTDLLPDRQLSLWPYTELSDPRLRLYSRLWTVRQSAAHGPFKIGILHPLGWVAYQLGDTVFCKHVPYVADQSYPDGGVNFELYTDQGMLELESLAPAVPLLPGATCEHVERWQVRRSAEDLSDPAHAAPFFASL